MSEALVSAILGQLTTVIYGELQQEGKLVTVVAKEIERLERNLVSIRDLLDDAEERQMKERSIQIWLESLKEVCYDMEDVLDEWNTALLKSQLDGADQNIFSLFVGKVCRLFVSCFCCGQVVHRGGIALKIKGINERFYKIAKDNDRYQLIPREVRKPSRVQSTGFTEAAELHGRDEVKKDLIDSLLCGDSDEIENDVKTISIVGMGGMGKTALAQLVYNDEAVMAHFEKKIWVFVSEVFYLSRVAKAIIVGLEGPDHASALKLDSLGLRSLLERIREDVKGKKVFLVLDDVWIDESKSWEPLNEALKLAASGSRILVTARKYTVVQAMKSFSVFPIAPLSHDACWSILSREAFVGRGERERRDLEDLGKKIAEKCSGLPLAAKTVGSMLRSKKTREWTVVLNSEIWKLNLIGIFTPLFLSYVDLPSAVRRCFLYCSTFPKGVEIEIDGLIYQWMAQGYFEMETTGVEYFECLVARSFFQVFRSPEDGSIRACKIHDIVFDFARFLMGNEYEVKEVHPHDDNTKIELSSEKTRHLSVILAENACIPTSLVGAEKLRSLSIFKSDHAEEDKTGNLFIQSKRLRSLIFCGGNVNEFPEEVDKLMLLKLLDLSRSKLKRLPAVICRLFNLQSLILRECSLERLPDEIEKLVNLRYLDTTGCDVTYYPKGIGRLTSLRTLLGIVVSCDHNDNKKFNLGDLENLCHLHFLALKVEDGKIDADEARRANLEGKIDLNVLKLSGPWENQMEMDHVIEVLNPYSHTIVTFPTIGFFKYSWHMHSARSQEACSMSP